MPEDAKANAPAVEKAAKAKPAAKKEAKPPAPEEKPLPEFLEQHFLPALQAAFAEAGLMDMSLSFSQKSIPVLGLPADEQYWQVEGHWLGGDRQFNLYYFDETLKGDKGFSCATSGQPASTLESFMIDERKVSLELMVMYTIQRLNSEKWLGGN
ncbi:MAG: DUF2996 domain-containing protein [Cyanobacteria bacterium P01_G01_bin.54]